MNNQKILKIVLLILNIFLVLYIFFIQGSSFETRRQIAFMEFEGYIDENNMDKKYFNGPYLDIINEKYLGFFWNIKSQIVDTAKIHVFVPANSWMGCKIVFTGDTAVWNALFNTDPNN